ncbi:hypothetical protein RclHR1_07910008 [Rhizophagus clarus]|nr:hypothetical protein RclHR1_07910008 [Rhizophagus clarus]
MRKIERYLKNIAEHPFQGKSLENGDVQAFYRDVMVYCFSKLQTRFEKLKRDITQNPQNEYVSQFVKFASIDVNNIDNVNLFRLSLNCYRFYQSIKAKPNTPKIFLEHLKKVASYHGSLKDIVNCARNEEYKKLFSNVRLRKLDPTSYDKYIYSWSNIIKRFIPDPIKYKDFKKTCLKDPVIANRLRSIYGVINNEILLDFEDVKLSAISVSKRCCYLCESYIKFANDNGYNIIIPGSHKKIYHSWKLPNIKGNSDFNEKSLSYLIEKLDQVIKDETNRSDSREKSRGRDSESDNPDEDYIDFYSKNLTLDFPNF